MKPSVIVIVISLGILGLVSYNSVSTMLGLVFASMQIFFFVYYFYNRSKLRKTKEKEGKVVE